MWATSSLGEMTFVTKSEGLRSRAVTIWSNIKGAAGYEDHRDVLCFLAATKAPQDLHAIHVGHAHVKQIQVEVPGCADLETN